MRVALVDDDLDIVKFVQLCLESEGHQCDGYPNANSFIAELQQQYYDLLIIDWMLPDRMGDEVLTWVRTHLGWQIPVLFITARDREEDIAHILRLGADDYMAKPLKSLEMLARIAALARRSSMQQPQQVMQIGCFEIDMRSHRIVRDGNDIDLTKREFELAAYLLQNLGRLLTRTQLLDTLWGKSVEVDTRTVDTHISRIRKKLELNETNGWLLIPVYGLGYRLEAVNNPAIETDTQGC